MPDYVKTDWVDNVTPVDEARMDHMEAGIDSATDDAIAALALGNGAIPKSLVDAKGDLIAASADNVVGRLPKGSDGSVLTADAAQALGIKWAAPGGGAALDYEGAWAAGTPYVQGDVVVYNGVTYGAVNPGTGQTPPAVASVSQFQGPIPLLTALPSSPFDGQEIVLTDSLTSPSWTWRLRYVAAKGTNKWVFIGGPPLQAENEASATITSTTYADLSGAANSPAITLPVAGDYFIEQGAYMEMSGLGLSYMSYAIGGTAAVDADATLTIGNSTNEGGTVHRRKRKNGLAAATVLAAKYRNTGGTTTAYNRWIAATPVAVGG